MTDRAKTKKELVEELTGLRQRAHDLEESLARLQLNERHTQAANALLRLYAQATTRKEYVGQAVKLINIWSDCRYVGIRMLNDKGGIPYEAYLGFSREFWEAENWLSIHSDQCACIRVVTGNPESQDIPMMTRAGSFYLDNSFEFLQSLTEAQRARFRGVCIRCGFKSIGIIPIALRGRILGVIHIADEKGGKVSLPQVEFLELMAFFMGQAIQKFSAAQDDKVSEAHLRLLMERSQDCVSLISQEGKYLGMNTAGCLLLKIDDPATILGQEVSAQVVEHRAEVEEALRRAAAREEAALQYQSLDLSGRGIWWDARLIPVRRTDGSSKNILSIARDITTR